MFAPARTSASPRLRPPPFRDPGFIAEARKYGDAEERTLTLRDCPTSMSDMKTFTARDLNRSPAKVLAAADRDGVARVRSRNGRTYSVKPEAPASGKVDWDAFVARRRAALKRLKMPPISNAAAAELDRLIAGE